MLVVASQHPGLEGEPEVTPPNVAHSPNWRIPGTWWIIQPGPWWAAISHPSPLILWRVLESWWDEVRDRWNLKFSGVVSCCRIGLHSTRWARSVGKRYQVIASSQSLASALHDRFATCKCQEKHAAFSEVRWHNTESYTAGVCHIPWTRTFMMYRTKGENPDHTTNRSLSWSRFVKDQTVDTERFSKNPLISGKTRLVKCYLGGGFKCFLFFTPIWGRFQFLTNIFQMGWNHQLVIIWSD